MKKISLFSLLLISAQLSASNANWISISDNNMATAANWSSGSVPDGVAIFNSSSPSGVVTSLAWDPNHAVPSFSNLQFSLNAFSFATATSASAFSFGFITTGTDAYGLVFNGAGITGQSTNASFTFDNTGITDHQYFPQLQFSPNGTSAIGEANITATNAAIIQNPPEGSLRKSNPQFLLDGSSNGNSVSATSNQCLITAQNNSLSLTNDVAALIAGFSNPGIDGVTGQFIISGSSNGVGDSNPGEGANGLASLTVDGAAISLTNYGEIEADNHTDISGGAGQWIIDGSSNGLALNYSGSGGIANASFTANNSNLVLNNHLQLISAFSNFIVGAEGQLVIKGNSTGTGRNAGIGTGGTGNASFNITSSTLTLGNQAAGNIVGASGSDITGAVGQLVIDGTSNGFASGTTGVGGNGNSSFSAESSIISLTNDGQLIGGQSNIAGGVGQLIVDGSSNSNANAGTANSGNGSASLTLNNTLLTLINANTIITSPSTPNNIMGAAGQLVVDGTCNSNNASLQSGSGHSVLTIDKGTILIKNYGSVTSLQEGGLAAQLVVDGSMNEQNSSSLGSGSAILNAGSNAVISVTNELSGTISATGSAAAQVYFHNASISGAPMINVSNLNPNAAIEGIIFDQNSSGGNAIISLINTSLVVDTTSSASPFSIGGLNGNSSSVVKLQTNDLQISTAQGTTTSFAGNITGSGKNLFIAGKGKQILSGTNTYTGSTVVNGGILELDGSVAQSVFVNDGGTITGLGSIGSSLTFSAGSTYLVTLSGNPFSTTCLHVGGTLSPSGTLSVVSSNGTYSIGRPYTIFTAGLLNPTQFTSIRIDSPWLIVTPIYHFDPSISILLSTNFSAAAQTENEQNVANQFDRLAVPIGDEVVVINELLGLDGAQLSAALEQMSGGQYTFLTQVIQTADRRFSERIFEAVRNATLPCSCTPDCQEAQFWIESGGGCEFYRGNKEVRGMRSPFFDVSLGAHVQITSTLLAGVAANYQRNRLDFSYGEKNTLNNGQAGIYGLWRGCSFYAFSDLVGGQSYSRIKRPLYFGTLKRTARSTPKFYHGAWYGEIGVDFQWCNWIIQPFLGTHITYVSANSFCERGAASLDLRIKKHQATCPDGYLGAHINFCADCTEINADLVWQHRFGSQGTTLHSRFVDFGDTFRVKGEKNLYNHFIGRLRVSQRLRCDFQIYGEAAGGCAIPKPNRLYNWSASGGICYAW